MITTTQVTRDNPTGLMDESFLEKKEGTLDNENEHTTWVEYYLHGELVHRSADVKLKKMPVGMEGFAATLFGEG